MCRRTSDGVTAEGDPTSLKKTKLESAHQEGLISGKLSARAAGTVTNEIPCTWHQVQL